jgi:hypothetical protein
MANRHPRNAPQHLVQERIKEMIDMRRDEAGVMTWDQLHCLAALHWNGEEVTVEEMFIIDPEVPPQSFPDLIAKSSTIAVRTQFDLKKKGEAPTLCGFALIHEAFAVQALQNPTRKERAKFQRDQRERRFHTRPDAEETLMGIAADIDGRLWLSQCWRSRPDQFDYGFWADRAADGIGTEGIAGTRMPGGAFADALYKVGQVVGVMLYDDPMTPEMVSVLSGQGFN